MYLGGRETERRQEEAWRGGVGEVGGGGGGGRREK